MKAVNIDEEFVMQKVCKMLGRFFFVFLMKNEEHRCFPVSSVEAVQDRVREECIAHPGGPV